MPTQNSVKTFFQGKQNRDNDPRVIQDGEYIRLVNGRIARSEGDGVGSVENVLGNEAVSTFVDANAVVLGHVRDIAEDRIYYFIKGEEEDAVYEYNEMTDRAIPLLRDNRGILNFNVNNLITSARIIGNSDQGDEDETIPENIRSQKLLIWTDNLNPPRKINVNRARARFNGELNNFTESEISLEKAPPLFAPQTSEVYLEIEIENASEEVLDSFLPDADLNLSIERKREIVELIIDEIRQEENLLEKFPRFAYRYRYEDNEYSAYSPFSPAMFRPGPFGYDEETGTITGMENQMRAIDVSFNTGGSDVIEVELLYKDSNSPTVYVIDSFNKADRGWRNNVDLARLNERERPVRFSTQKLYRALPDDQLARVYDDVPLRAKTLEIVDNRVMFANYVDRYDLLDVRKEYSSAGNLERTIEEEIVVDFDARISRPEEIGQEGDTIQAGIGERSLKSDRDYELGIVYLDALGRQTPVLTSENNSVNIPVDRANRINRVSVEINSKAPEFATHYRFFIKDTRAATHHNIIPLESQVQPDDDAFIWFRLADTDQGKVSEGDYLVLKVNGGMFSYLGEDTQKIRVRVEEVGIRGRNFLEVNPPRTGRIENIDDDGNVTEVIDEGEIYTAQRPGLWMRIANISQFPQDDEQPARSTRSNSRSNNARNSNFRPIKGINHITQPDWKDFTYYYRGSTLTDEDVSEDAITFSSVTFTRMGGMGADANNITSQSGWTPGGGMTGTMLRNFTSPEFGPTRTDTVNGYGPMRVQVEILESNEYRFSWWLSPSAEEPAVVRSSAIGTITSNTAQMTVNGVTVTFNLPVDEYRVGDRWVTTYRTPSNFMWRCWEKSGGANSNRYADPNSTQRYAFNARRSHIMLYGPGVLESGINGNSMIQFGVEDGLERVLDGNPIALPFQRNTYYTEDVFYPTLEEWMFEEGYWSSGGNERLIGTDRDGANVGIHQFGFYRGVPITPEAEFSGIERALTYLVTGSTAIGSAELLQPRNLLRLALGVFIGGGTSIIGALLSSLVKGKSTRDYWRLQSDDPARLLFEDDEGRDAAPLYAFVQSGTYNSGRNNKKAERRQRSRFSFFQGNGASEDQITGLNISFETIPEETAQDVYYEIGETYTCLNGVHFGNEMSNHQQIYYLDTEGNRTFSPFTETMDGTIIPHTETAEVTKMVVNLEYFNCFAWNNGIEVKSVRDEFGTPALDQGAKASTVIDNYEQATNSANILFSQRFNQQLGVNRLNEFSSSAVALGTIVKEMDELDGSIQHLFSRDTNLVVFQEDKVNQVLVNKDQLVNADGTSNITQSQNVLGQTVPYAGEYGISTNPESFAVYGNRLYFTDANRGVVCRLSQNGIEEISNYGMRDFFREELRYNYGTLDNPISPIVIGSYDDYHDQYICSIREPLRDPAIPRVSLPLLLSKQAFLSRTDACRYPEQDLQYTQVYEFYTDTEPEGFQIGDIIYYNQDRTFPFRGDNDWFVWFEDVTDVDYSAASAQVGTDGAFSQTFNFTENQMPARERISALPGQPITVASRGGAAGTNEYQATVVGIDGNEITVRYNTEPTIAIAMGDPIEISARFKFVINIDNFGVVRNKLDCQGILPPSYDAMRISIRSYTSPQEACAKGIVARLIYHDGDDPSADVGDDIFDTPYGIDEFFEGEYFKGRTQKRGWYQMFDGEDLEDYVINIVQGRVVDKIRCAEISAGRRRVLTTQNPVIRSAGETERRLSARVCAVLPTEVSFHNGEGNSPVIGDSIFQDGFTNSPLAPGYYALEGGFYIRVAENGLIAEKRLCSVTICVDDIVEERLTFNRNRNVNRWTWRGIGADFREFPNLVINTPTIGTGQMTLNGTFTSLGEFSESGVQYDWYYLRDPGAEPTQRGIIEDGILVRGGMATEIGPVDTVDVTGLAAFTTYYVAMVATVERAQIVSEILPVTLSRSTVPTVTIATTTALSPTETPIGDAVSVTTTVAADNNDNWNQLWQMSIDGGNTWTDITGLGAAATGPFTGTAAATEPGGTYGFNVAVLPAPNQAVTDVQYRTQAIFAGLTPNPISNVLTIRRGPDTNRLTTFTAAATPVTRTTAASALPVPLNDRTLALGNQDVIHAFGSRMPAGVTQGNHPADAVLQGTMFTQTETYTETTHNAQIETEQTATCQSADGCTFTHTDGRGVTTTQTVAFNEMVTRFEITTPSVPTTTPQQTRTRQATGTAAINSWSAEALVDGTRMGGVVTWSHGNPRFNAYLPLASSVFVGQTVDQTRTSNYIRTTSAVTQDGLYTCQSVDVLNNNAPACTQGPTGVTGGTFNMAAGTYLNEDVERVPAMSESLEYTNAEATAAGVDVDLDPSPNNNGVPGTRPLPVNGTASFGPTTATGAIHGGTGGVYANSGTSTVSQPPNDNTQATYQQTTTYSIVTETFTGAVQDGIRTCNEVTPPQHGGNAGTCNGVAIGQTQTRPDFFTGLTRTETVTATTANGGIVSTTVNNPNYLIATFAPAALSWNAQQGDGTTMTFAINAMSHGTPTFAVTATGGFTANNVGTSVVVTRNGDAAATGAVTITGTINGNTYTLGSVQLNAVNANPCAGVTGTVNVTSSRPIGTARPPTECDITFTVTTTGGGIAELFGQDISNTQQRRTFINGFDAGVSIRVGSVTGMICNGVLVPSRC